MYDNYLAGDWFNTLFWTHPTINVKIILELKMPFGVCFRCLESATPDLKHFTGWGVTNSIEDLIFYLFHLTWNHWLFHQS